MTANLFGWDCLPELKQASTRLMAQAEPAMFEYLRRLALESPKETGGPHRHTPLIDNGADAEPFLG